MEYQEYYGKKFYLDQQTGYWISTTIPHIRAHVWVWEKAYGKRPKGFHIHHKDGNKSKNQIENLELLDQAKHLREHMTPERRQLASENARKQQPATKEWHHSEEGVEWHRKNGVLTWKNRKEKSGICKECAKEFFSKTYHQDFCSNKCKSKWRRKSGKDDIDRICLICKKTYKVNKYAKRKYCSRRCAWDAKIKKNKVDKESGT